ncbi:MAG TPA: hypothetical protein DIW17_05700 [Clostridiales bacterium]|nr:hypothetical protein [Clostridiales bacterium]
MFSLVIAGLNKTNILKTGSLRIKRAAEGRNECGFTLVTPFISYSPAIGAEVVASLDGKVVFGGVIKERKIQRLNRNGTIYSSVTVTCQGYNHIPKRRTIQYQPDSVSAGNAVKYMLENVLSSEGITEGLIEDGIMLYGYDADLKSVREVLDDLAGSCGYKWYIDDEKQLFFLKNDTVPEAPFELLEQGGSFTDYKDVEVTDSLEGYRNKQFVRAGDRIVTLQNDTEIAARAAVEGGTGVYGEVEENSNVQERNDALALAEELLARYGEHIPATISFTTNTAGFDAGQRLHVSLPSLGASGNYLIEQVDISEAGNGLLQFTIGAVKKNFEKTTKRKETWQDYFQGLVNGGTGSKGSNEEGALVYSSETLVIGTTDKTTLNLSPTVSNTTHLYLSFTITGNTTNAAQLQVNLQFNGETVRTYKHLLNAGYNTMSVSTIISSVKAGSHSVRLVLSLSSGTLTIAAGEHDGYIRAIGMAGIGTAPPEVNWVEPIGFVSVGGGITIFDVVSVETPTAVNLEKQVFYINTERAVTEENIIDTTGVDNCLWFRYPEALAFHARACVPFFVLQIKFGMEPNALKATVRIKPPVLTIQEKTAINPDSIMLLAAMNNANVEVV